MYRYANTAEFAHAARQAGGFRAMVFDGRLSMDQLPPDTPSHIRAFIRKLILTRTELREVEKYLAKPENRPTYEPMVWCH